MNIEQKELINIIREELAEALGMDASYDRQNLTMKLRDFLDEYTGDDLQAAMDALENVQAMLRRNEPSSQGRRRDLTKISLATQQRKSPQRQMRKQQRQPPVHPMSQDKAAVLNLRESISK